MHVYLSVHRNKLSLGKQRDTDQWPAWGVPHLLPNDSWDRLQPPHDPELDKQKKIDGLRLLFVC